MTIRFFSMGEQDFRRGLWSIRILGGAPSSLLVARRPIGYDASSAKKYSSRHKVQFMLWWWRQQAANMRSIGEYWQGRHACISKAAIASPH